ncbi:MAG: PhoH family protein, partial [Firmicutes bacterium]|nr:PhoH family protein [Bacillota bacterium]
SRIIDNLRATGNLLKGVPLNDQGGILRIETNHLDTKIPANWPGSKPDNRILQVCKGLSESNHYPILVSRDTNMRVKATILTIHAEDFRNEKVASIEEQYTGRGTIYTTSEVINRFHEDVLNTIDPILLFTYDENAQILINTPLETNQFFLIRSTDNDRHTALGRFDGEKVVHLRYQHHNPFGVVPRNIGQIFMQECLMMSASEAPLVIIKGPAGTAKTFYSLAVGLHQHFECRPRDYNHILICRPNVPMDEDIGFLPGSEVDKVSPFMRGIRDNLFTLMNGNTLDDSKDLMQAEDTIQILFDKHTIQTEALEKMRGSKLCFQVTLQHDECERSPLAAEAAMRL